MANDCSYQMKVKGENENVEEFIKVIQAEYWYDENDGLICTVDRHFWRVSDAYVEDEGVENGIRTVYITGTCAWSVYSCMMEGTHTYNNMHPQNNGTTLQKESEKLQLTIEVFSEECGCAFMEHFVYDKGKEIINDCVNWYEYWTGDFDNVEQMNKEYNTEYTEEEFENNEYLTTGGMEWIFDQWQ